MKEQLVKLGLTENESKIYLFLLKNPSISTGPIIKHTNISNSQVYESINKLISKGLIEYVVLKNGKHFTACSPEKFYERENERKKIIDDLIPKLKEIRQEKKEVTNTAVFEGFEGFKTAFNNIIENCPENETIRILGFSNQEYLNKSLRLFLKNANLKSINKKQKLKVLLDQKTRNTLGKDREKEKYTEVKYMPKEYVSPMAVDIFEDFVYMFLWDENPYVFMIKNEKIANSFKNYFDQLWNISK